MFILFNLIPKLSDIFSNNSFSKRVSLTLRLIYFVFTRKFFLKERPMRFDFFFLGKPFTVFVHSNVELAGLYEVFVLEEYSWHIGPSPKIIVDLGAHIGDTALYYHLVYPEALIYAIEPAPDTFLKLKQNVSGIPSITPIQAGLSDKDGSATLHMVPSSLGNSFFDRDGEVGSVTVPVYTLATLLQKCHTKRADIIKFDIEGGEANLFVTGTPSDFSNHYIGEVHLDLISLSSEDFLYPFEENFLIERENLSNKNRFILRASRKEASSL